jgi:hypothetical protein
MGKGRIYLPEDIPDIELDSKSTAETYLPICSL